MLQSITEYNMCNNYVLSSIWFKPHSIFCQLLSVPYNIDFLKSPPLNSNDLQTNYFSAHWALPFRWQDQGWRSSSWSWAAETSSVNFYNWGSTRSTWEPLARSWRDRRWRKAKAGTWTSQAKKTFRFSITSWWRNLGRTFCQSTQISCKGWPKGHWFIGFCTIARWAKVAKATRSKWNDYFVKKYRLSVCWFVSCGEPLDIERRLQLKAK